MDADAQPIECEARAAALLAEARLRMASHLHIEGGAQGVSVRMRIGGALGEPLRFHEDPALLAGFRSLPGAARLETAAGERIVVRVGGEDRTVRPFEELGMQPATIGMLRPALARGGLVLVSGPPGSGRTQTLHAVLRYLTGTRSLIALGEDAPEGVVLAGPVSAGLLREALRQDADVIAIDSLATPEQAGLAVEAAGAGVLVIAVVEAANAVAAIGQMRAWRVDSFQIASVLAAATGQQRVARLCAACRRPEQAKGSVSALLGLDPGRIVYAPVGCAACGGSGYAGDTAVFECIAADAGLRRLINDGGDAAILARHAYLGAPNLGSAARALVGEGVIAADAAIRLSKS